jgi:small subunit ribosomal protein S13
MNQKEFNYIVRIANTDLDGSKQVPYALTKIKGINERIAFFVADRAEIARDTKIGLLTEEEISRIENALAYLQKSAPNWLVNRQKDQETGADKHLIGSDLDLAKREDVNLAKKIHAYRGIRHELGLRVRGQRTRAHPRRGLTVGVVRAKILKKVEEKGKKVKGVGKKRAKQKR